MVDDHWARTERAVFGLTLELPETWSLNEATEAAAIVPLPPADDGAVVIRVIHDGAGRRPTITSVAPLTSAQVGGASAWVAPTQWSIVEQGSGTTDDRGTSVDYGLFWSETRAGTVLVAALVKRDAPPAARAAVQRIVSSIQIVEPPGDRAGMRRDLAGRAVYGRGEEEGDDGRAGDKDNADDENEEEDVP